jgi:hypothetical protein
MVAHLSKLQQRRWCPRLEILFNAQF